ncbi:hypothetical protein Ddc_05615 [Ditylenchus destructor]|nr:hypothetical protein Ddc_05615 [Ditylenchus destructor]
MGWEDMRPDGCQISHHRLGCTAFSLGGLVTGFVCSHRLVHSVTDIQLTRRKANCPFQKGPVGTHENPVSLRQNHSSSLAYFLTICEKEWNFPPVELSCSFNGFKHIHIRAPLQRIQNPSQSG